MWSYSSCAKLHQKYHVFTVFFIVIKKLCTALADNAWLTANPEESVTNYDWVHSIPNYVIKKGPTHGARHGKTEIQKRVPTTRLEMRGRDAVIKSTLKVNILQVFTIDFSEIQFVVNHNSQSDGQNRRAKSLINLQRRPYISSHSRGKENIPSTMVSYFEESRQKWAYETSIWFSSRRLDEKSSTPRIRRTSWKASPSRSTKTMAFIFKHMVVGQVWRELEVSS